MQRPTRGVATARVSTPRVAAARTAQTRVFGARFAVAGLLVVSLAGCAIQPASAVTDDEARDRFFSALDETQTLVGGQWQVLDDPTARECVIPLWVAGQRYPALRVGDAPLSIVLAADRVETAWNEQGMRVTRTDVGNVVEVTGESTNGEVIIFRVSDSASTLLGESECRPT